MEFCTSLLMQTEWNKKIAKKKRENDFKSKLYLIIIKMIIINRKFLN